MVPHRLKLSVDIYSQNMKQQTMPFYYQGQLKAIAIVDRTSIFGRPKHALQFQVGYSIGLRLIIDWQFFDIVY